MENWIFAKKFNGESVTVRQGEAGSKLFIGNDGKMYDVSDLDFTQIHPLDADFLRQFEECNKRYAEQQVEHQELLNKMLSSMDANAIADHKAKIDEREYWRKLRWEIFMQVFKEASENATRSGIVEYTKYYFDALYEQDKDFFKDK